MKFRNFEHYAILNGASILDLGDFSLHRGKNTMSSSSKQRAVKLQYEKDKELMERRSQLRKEYEEKVRSGEISEESRIEKLTRIAQGFPEDPSTAAAVRLLEKHKIYLISQKT